MESEELKLLGALDERTKLLLSNQQGQRAAIGKIFERLERLPCTSHDENINELMGWKSDCNGNTKAEHIEQVKGTISLRNALTVGVIITLIAAAPSIILIIQNAK